MDHVKAPHRGTYGIYIHYPLCLRRCGYCDFAIVPQDKIGTRFASRAYTNQVIREFGTRCGDYEADALRTIYLGGGTPSLWPIDELAALLESILSTAPDRSLIEVTIEANPEDLSLDYLRELVRIGITRISLGVQSLDDDTLVRLTRHHSSKQVRQVMRWLDQVGVPQCER